MSGRGRFRRFVSFAVLAGLLAVPFAGLAVVLTPEAAGAAITNFTDGSIGTVGGIVAGPDGGLWFTNEDRDSIGRMDPTTHLVTAYTGTGIDVPTGIAVGPDGALWFTNRGNDSIGRIDPSTHAVTNYTGTGINNPTGITAGPTGDPNSLWFTNSTIPGTIGRIDSVTHAVSNFDGGGPSAGIEQPDNIVAGPDGQLWFTNAGNDYLDAIDTIGNVSAYQNGTSSPDVGIAVGSDGKLWFTNPGDNSIGSSDTSGNITSHSDASVNAPFGIVAGPDGQLWFANSGNGTIGSVDPQTLSFNSYSGSRLSPTHITVGPDGALWFTNPGFSNVIGRITAPSVVSNFADASISHPGGITAGPDGALWFVNETSDSIGRISTSGVVTNYTGTGISLPYGIVTGPDDALWFTNLGNDSIGRIDPGTHAVTNYPGASISGPLNIVVGSDGALWFPNEGNDSIGRIDPATHVVTGYPDVSISQPSNIAAGPDGALWFTNQGSNTIGRIDPATHVVTNHTDASISNPTGITSGPDGALWFVNNGTDSIGRISTGGAVTNYTGASISGPVRIVAGPDGALWFTNQGNNSIGRIDTNGNVEKVDDPTISSPTNITVGPDNALWFTNFTNNTIGRITTGGAGGDVSRYGGQGPNAPGAIVAGSDGALWFVNGEDSSISRMTTGGTVTNNYPVASAFRMTAGPDGALWFTDPANNRIGRITTSGVVSYYGDPSISNPNGIAVGSDGALWFTNHDSNSIGRIDPTTHVVTNYTFAGVNQPFEIFPGPDGALWFDQNLFGNSIGRIDTSGNITIYSSSSFAGGIGGLAAGPDGTLWAARLNGAILRIDPSDGSVIDTFTGPNINGPFDLTLGSDGAFYYFTQPDNIGRITTDGTSTSQADPNMNNPSSMTLGPDSAVWYTNDSNNSIGRDDANGVANAPTGVSGTPADGQVGLSWSAPANDGANTLTDYAVTVFNGSGGAATGVTGATTRLVGSATTNFAFTGLTNGTAYTFKVAAVNVAGTGTLSALSSPATPFSVPGAPTGVVAASGNGQVSLHWTAPADTGGLTLTNYSVSVFDSVGGTATGVSGASTRLIGSAATNYTFTGLTNATGYTFEVAAVNSGGTGAQSALSSPVTASTFNVPALIPNPGTAGSDSGYAVNNSVTISATGQWCPDGTPADCVGPDGSVNAATPGSLLVGPSGQFGLVGRIGTSGAWTLIGSGPVTLNGKGELFLAMNDVAGQFADNSGALQVSVAPLDGVTGTTPPVSATLTSGYDAAWSVPIINESGVAMTGVSATVHANANGPVPLPFHTAIMPGCSAVGNSDVCSLPNVPAHSTYLFNVYVPTTGLLNGRTISGDVAVSANGGLNASGNLGTVAIVNCGTSCVVAVAPPGVPIASSAPPAAPSAPPQQTVTLPGTQAGSTPEPVAVTLSTITPSASLPASDQKLCPTAPGQTKCSGKISSVVADFSKFNDAAHPIKVKIVTDWGSTVPAGKTLMEKKTGGDPLFLLGCVLNAAHHYNTPCLLSETIAGTTNKSTTDTIFFTGLDIHFARRVASGGGTAIKPPSAPTGLTVTAGTSNAVLKWRAPTATNGAGVTSYVVTVLSAGKIVKTVTYPSPLLTETMTGLTNAKAYTFKVAAGNVAGVSAASAVSAAYVVGAPGAPTRVTAVKTTSGHLKVTFTAPAATNGAPITGYTATCTSSNLGATKSISGTASPLTVSSLSAGKKYTCTVKAKNSRGLGPPSAASTAVTA